MVVAMASVLCCLDDPHTAEAVAHYATRLADALGHQLVLVHVAPSTHAPGVSAAPAGRQRLHEEEHREAVEALERLAARAGVRPDVARRAAIGDPAGKILELCEQEQAELVVLGSHGRRGLRAALLGSVSTAVAARSPCPCVIVSPAAAERAETSGGRRV
jgi:nucleotide-binding universal stress UspA family protein